MGMKTIYNRTFLKVLCIPFIKCLVKNVTNENNNGVRGHIQYLLNVAH